MSAAKCNMILVVDDDPVIVDLFDCFLSTAGYQVLTAGAGPDGLALARQHLPAAILCDMGLPGLSGAEILTALRQDNRTSSIPFVLVTGQEDPAFTDFTPTAIVKKPFKTNAIVEMIGSLVNSSGAAAAA